MIRWIVESKIYKEVFDILINLNDPLIFDFNTRSELEDETKNLADQPRGKLAKILCKYREQNGTFGGLSGAFKAIRKRYP